MRSDRQPERRQPGPAGQSGTCSGSSAVEQPCQRGLRAGSIPAPSTSHPQPRDYVRYTLLFESGSCAAMGRSVSDAACGN